MTEDTGPRRCSRIFFTMTGAFFLIAKPVYAQSETPKLSPSTLALQIGLIVFLTLVNAFFSAAEMAMVSIDKNKIKDKADEGDRKSIKILKVLSNQSRFLSTIQVLITFAGFFNSASAATGLGLVLGSYLSALGLPYAENIATVLITVILSYVTIVIGELVPKRIALSHSEEFARSAIGLIAFASKILSPFVSLLSMSTNAVLRILGVTLEGVEEKVTIEQIRSMVQVGQDQGVINPVESEMIHSVISFDDKYAEEIMTARPEVFMIDITEPLENYLSDMLTLKYSRIPVYEEDVDNIIGVLYIKDFFLEAHKKGFNNVDIRPILRPAYLVPERKNINNLFNDLQTNQKHMALLIDEYGGFSGIVTMEDLIEEIVGDIDDEYDHDEPDIIQLSDNSYQAKGGISIKELNYRTGSEFGENSEHYDTLGGLVIYELGYIPADGEKPELWIDNVQLLVSLVEDNRISEVKILVHESEDKAKEEQIEEE